MKFLEKSLSKFYCVYVLQPRLIERIVVFFFFLSRNVCEHYNGTIWANTGPYAVTRTLKDICNVTKVIDMKPEICGDFNVLPEKSFYPIYADRWNWFFDANLRDEALKQMNDSVAVHFWNTYSIRQSILREFKNKTLIEKYKEKLTKNKEVKNPFGESAYGAMAKKNCPKVYAASGDLF